MKIRVRNMHDESIETATYSNAIKEYEFVKNVMGSKHLNEYEKVYFIKRFLDGEYNHLTDDELYNIYY